MSDPVVSLIIPVRNGERTLRDCLDSCLDQTFDDFELIIVDNGSFDGTVDIIKEYEKKDGRIRPVREERKGRGSARNRGISVAKGKITAWTDADCVVPRDWLEKITHPIREDGEEVVQGNEDAIGKGFWSREAQKAGQRHIMSHITGHDRIDHIDTKNLALRTGVLKRVGGFNTDIDALEDFDLKIRLKKEGITIYYMGDLKVKHHHREDLISLFRSRLEQGYWAALIYFRNRVFFDGRDQKDNTVRSMYPSDILMFPIHLCLCLPKLGLSGFIFETVTGVMWRMGNIKGRLAYGRSKKGA
ncbi:MAG: glycosyltransferase [Candidatus Thermoplasmatota archaeon]|nr:glycosyltransferase [Candidatus Thermoplasmatota archaeon]